MTEVLFYVERDELRPMKQHRGDSGYDLRANIKTPFIILALQGAIIPTGVFAVIPENFEIQVRSRSGLAANHCLQVLNSPGTVDSGFLGEIKIILFNHYGVDYTVNPLDRIAQAVICKLPVVQTRQITLAEFSKFSSDRNANDFGSTGK